MQNFLQENRLIKVGTKGETFMVAATGQSVCMNAFYLAR